MTRLAHTRRRRSGERGQSLVEFSLAITIFLLLVMGTVDLGRAAYQYNGVAQAARELARVASVHPGGTLGSSTQVAAVLATQRGLIPGLGTPTYTCLDIAGAPVSGTCSGGNWVRVTINSTFTPVTPMMAFLGVINLSSSASARIE
ncbi:MAG TPA: TadE/TadG family type IV pilus assembly protein [Candidatus Limnocylindrales bacterium]